VSKLKIPIAHTSRARNDFLRVYGSNYRKPMTNIDSDFDTYNKSLILGWIFKIPIGKNNNITNKPK